MLQPSHLIFILMILLILFGPGRLPDLGRGFRRATSHLRGVPSEFRNAVFMAKGVDPSVGRDVGDMLPDDPAKHYETVYLCLLALLIGNTIYFLILPLLPEPARIDAGFASGLPAVVDLLICIMVFGMLELLRLVHQQRKPRI